MSFEPPEGILDIGNATLRVGKLEVAETSGLNQGLQNIIKNDLLITENNESSPYTTNQKWGLKLPTTWVAEFEVKGHSGKYIDFNFYNENSASNALGYNLTFMDTSLTLKYDGGNNLPITGDTVDSTLSLGDAGYGVATIPTIVGAYRKVNIFFERGVISVSIDGTRYLYFKESDGYNQGLGVASRVVSATGSAFVNLFIESDNENNSKFKNLRIVNGRFISDKTSNIAFMGGNLGVGVNSPQETLDIRGNMHLTRVSNVSQIKVESNVVTEYTGPHDRPLRKYPEVAFPLSTSSESAASGATTFTYKGYTVTSNSVYSGTAYKISNAFDGTATSWSGNLGDYDSNGDVASGRTANYLQIQLPNAIKLENIKITSEANYEYANGPRNITLYGSNNGSNWVTLKTETDLPLDGGTTNPDPQTAFVHVNTTTKYLYYKLEISKIYISSGGATYARIGEWELYGHEEGSGSLDTTLKTVYNVPATTGTQLEVYYDAKDLAEMPSTVTDLSPNTNTGALSTSPPTLDTTDGIESFKFDASSSQRITSTIDTSYWGTNKLHSVSFWLKADTVGGKFNIFQIGNAAANEVSAFWISDGSADSNGGNSLNWWSYGGDSTLKTSSFSWALDTWYHIALTFDGSTKKLYVNGKYIEFSVNNTVPTANLPTGIPASASLLVGSSSVGGGGDYFDGSIANFRVYGAKVLNTGQVQELYDYQKDYFLGSKSQVTLYKGHLGVGVTEPSGQLELAGDERIQEYPPRALTGYETLVEGHGVFCAYTNSFYTPGNYLPYYAFDKQHGPNFATTSWNTNNPTYSTSTGLPTTGASLGGYTGESLTLKLPYSVKVSQYQLSVRGAWYTYGPDSWVILGSNDDNNWEVLDSVSSANWPTSSGDTELIKKYTVNNTKYYKYLALVVTKAANSRAEINLSELRYFGTPGPTTLDKGSLTLGRSLDVPRVSRYDVDTETPRPEKIVLDFDTTVNSSPTDISGEGNHGAFVGNAQYSASDKAFTGFPSSSSNYIKATLNGASGAYAHTQSYWINGADTTPRVAFTVGTNTGTYSYLYMWLNTSKWVMSVDGFGFQYVETIDDNRWYHITVTYDGGSVQDSYKFYLNGEYKTPTSVDNASSFNSLNLPSNPEVRIGRDENVQWYNGMVSNPKIYSVALEASEVKKLYRLGRTGRSMIISDTAVGIGKVPEAQLDVRGNLAVRGDIESFGPNMIMTSGGDLSIKGQIYSSYGMVAPFFRSSYNTYGFDGTWRTLLGTGTYDCGIGFLVHQTLNDTAMFRFAHNGAGTKHVGFIYNSGYTNITYSGNNIKVQGPGGITRGYILHLNT